MPYGAATGGPATIQLSGTVTPTGALVKDVTKPLAGTATPTGALAKRADKSLAGTVIPSGALTLVKLTLLALAGTITPVGSLLKQAQKPLAGTVTPAGALIKQTQKGLGGTVTPTGSIVKVISKALSGLLGVKAFSHVKFVGMTTPDHADYAVTDLDYEIYLRLEDWTPDQVTIIGGQTSILANHGWAFSIGTDGSIAVGTSPDGSSSGQITCTLANPGFAVGSAHTLRCQADVDDGASGKRYKIFVDGTVEKDETTAGTTSIFNSMAVLTTSNPALPIRGGVVYWAKLRSSIDGSVIANPIAEDETLGATSFDDANSRTWTFDSGGYVGRDLYGKLTNVKVVLRSFTGTITPTGALVKSALKAVAGTVIPAGTLVRQDQKTLGGTTTPTGSIRKAVTKPLAGSVTPTGTLTNLKLVVRAFAGAITPVGTLLRQTQKSLGGTVTPTGSIRKDVSKSLGGTVTPEGGLRKFVTKFFSGVIAAVGTLLTEIPSGIPLQLKLGDLRRRFGVTAMGRRFGTRSFVRHYETGGMERRYDAGDMERRYGTGDMTREP